MVHIARYALFLLLYIAMFAANYFISYKPSLRSSAPQAVWRTAAFNAVVIVFMFGSVWLLVDTVSPVSMAFVGGFYAAATVLLALVSAFFRPSDPAHAAAEQLATFEMTYLNPRGCFMFVFIVLAIICLCLYPIIVARLYFGSSSQAELLQQLVGAHIALFSIGAYPVIVAVNIWTLSNGNLDQQNRVYALSRFASGMMYLALYAALALWAFNIGGPEITLNVFGLTVALSPIPPVVVVIYIVLVGVLPYLLGSVRNRDRQLATWTRQTELLREAIDSLLIPKNAQRLESLRSVEQKASDTTASMLATSKALALFREIDAGRLPDNLKDNRVLLNVYPTSRRYDHRLIALDWLERFRARLDEILEELASKRTERSASLAAEGWAKLFANERDDLAGQMKSTQSSRHPLVVAAGLVGTLVIAPVISEIAKASWQSLSQSLGT